MFITSCKSENELTYQSYRINFYNCCLYDEESFVRNQLMRLFIDVCTAARWRVHDFIFFDSLNSFNFLLLEFRGKFSISYKIEYCVYYYCISIRCPGLLFQDFILFHAHFTSLHTHSYFLTLFFCFFVLFHSCCSHARVSGKTLLHEFHISYSNTECYIPFLTVHLQVHNVYSERKSINTCALVNPNL